MLQRGDIDAEYVLDMIGHFNCLYFDPVAITSVFSAEWRRGITTSSLERLRLCHLRMIHEHPGIWAIEPFLQPLGGECQRCE